tara:strand:- start:4393 stop:5328 length:936 start_codon:yes stop_codon:yes gene_type:complete
MATTQNITTSFSGKAAEGYLSAALLSGKTLDSGAIDIRDNIQYKEVIQVLSSDANLIKPGTCDFDSTGTLSTTEIVLEPKEIQVNLEVCAKNFRSSWESLQLRGINSTLPQTFGEFILEHVVSKTAAAMESAIWTGTTVGDIPFDGIEVLANANADVVDVAKGAITASTVTTELGKVVDAIPSTIYGKEDLYIYVPSAIYQAYVRALGGFGAAGSSNVTAGVDDQMNTWYRNQQELFFDGIKLLLCPGMTSTDMVATTKSNLIFGTSLFSDMNQASIIDMGPIDGSQNSRVILRGSAAVALGIGSEIVLYS